jgi:hypothetical protein
MVPCVAVIPFYGYCAGFSNDMLIGRKNFSKDVPAISIIFAAF